jgi:hypothetical protein
MVHTESFKSTPASHIQLHIHKDFIQGGWVLQEQLLHSFRFLKVQNLNRNDFDQRVQFCRCFLNSTQQNEKKSWYFLSMRLRLQREGMFNSMHVWAAEDPDATQIFN